MLYRMVTSRPVRLRKGDLIIAGTDGLFDNVGDPSAFYGTSPHPTALHSDLLLYRILLICFAAHQYSH